MPHNCFVNGCHNRSDDQTTKRSFYAIPAIISHQGEQTKELSSKRREAWIAQINRKKAVTKYSKVCSDHFVEGKPADLYNSTHPDWVPTLKMRQEKLKPKVQDEQQCQSEKKMYRYQRAKDRQGRRKMHIAAEALIHLANSDHLPAGDTDDTCEGVRTNMLCTFSQRGKLESSSHNQQKDDENMTERIRLEFQNLLTENQQLKKQLLETKFTPESFEGNDSKVKYITGLPGYLSLMAIFTFVEPYITESSQSSLTKFQKIIMVLMKLRLNTPVQDLAYRFGVSKSTVSRAFISVIHVMYERMKILIHWPDREELRSTMPLAFRRNFGLKVAVIIDCFEIFIERPSNLLSRSETWSQYKHHNTVKYLIGVTPQGSISFLSRAWGGRTSDKHITEQSGLLKKLLPGDVVLADRGFDIQESVGLMCAEVKIPAFTKGKQQLSALEVESTRKIANVRIHVERVIGLVRNKYTILQDTLPIDYLQTDGEQEPLVDKLVTVCAALTNCCDSVVPFD